MRRIMSLLVFILVAAGTAAAAEGAALNATDVRYLKTLGQSQSELQANRPTPAMLQRLHELINDPATQQKPRARADAVNRFLDHINAQFIWCTDHPADKDCEAYKAPAAP